MAGLLGEVLLLLGKNMSDLSNLASVSGSSRPEPTGHLPPKRAAKTSILAVYDGLAASAAVAIALVLVEPGGVAWSLLLPWMLGAGVLCAVLFPLAGTYSAHLRHASLGDLIGLTFAAAILSVALAAVSLVVPDGGPRLAVFAVFFLTLMPLLGAPRVYYRREDLRGSRAFPRRAIENDNRESILLIGQGPSCDLFLRSLRRESRPKYNPVGILEDSGSRGSSIHSIPVLGSFKDTETVRAELVARNIHIDRIVLTEPLTRLGTKDLSSFLAWARFEGMAVSQLPPLTAFQSLEEGERLGLTDLNISDLLERPEARVDYDMIKRMVAGRRVLITGAGGSIGSELARQIAALDPSQLVLIENSEYNHYQIEMDLKQSFAHVDLRSYICCIRDADRLREIFYRHQPEVVFNAAALKHVPIVEANPCEGVLTNVIGTRNVADIASETGAVAMIQISTDKAVNTCSVMGATKRVAEFYAQALDRRGGTRFMTVRFGNVLGSSGSLIPLFQSQIAKGGPLTVTDPRMTRFFMTIREAVELTLLASATGIEKGIGQGRIMVLDMGAPMRIMDIAHRMITLAGLKPDIDIEIKTTGIRPGEKLFEELFDVAEERHPSGIPGVNAAIPEGVALDTLRCAIATLERAARRGQRHLVVSQLAEIVPGYVPFDPTESAGKMLDTGADAKAEQSDGSMLSRLLPARREMKEERAWAR